jgi:hypothetical protein
MKKFFIIDGWDMVTIMGALLVVATFIGGCSSDSTPDCNNDPVCQCADCDPPHCSNCDCISLPY